MKPIWIFTTTLWGVVGLIYVIETRVFAHAQEITPTNASFSQSVNEFNEREKDIKSLITADFNLSNFQVLSQDDHRMYLAVDFVNNSNFAQTDVKFGIELIRNSTSTGQEKIDTYTYNDVLTLAPKQTLHKEFEYLVPGGISGDVELWMISMTTGGTVLGVSSLGKINLTADSFVEIKPGSCFLRVGDGDARYSLQQGIDLNYEENLFLSCEIQNYSPESLNLRPSFKTYERTVYGNEIDIVQLDSEDILLGQEEARNIDILIPKPNKPQAYDVVVTLHDSTKSTVVSGEIIAHYVVRGESATIQNLFLDKGFYKKGETAILNMVWTPSADQFFGSRYGRGSSLGDVIVTIDVVDSNKRPCAVNTERRMSQEETNISIPFLIQDTCVAPRVSVSLKDDTGRIYDSRIIYSPIILEDEEYSAYEWIWVSVFSLLATLVFVGWFTYGIWTQKKQNQEPSNI